MSTLTNSTEFKEKVACVVLSRTAGAFRAQVYRESTTAPTLYSCDVYEITNGAWGARREQRNRKYEPPEIPQGAKCYREGGVDFYNLTDPTKEERKALRDLMGLLGGGR